MFEVARVFFLFCFCIHPFNSSLYFSGWFFFFVLFSLLLLFNHRFVCIYEFEMMKWRKQTTTTKDQQKFNCAIVRKCIYNEFSLISLTDCNWCNGAVNVWMDWQWVKKKTKEKTVKKRKLNLSFDLNEPRSRAFKYLPQCHFIAETYNIILHEAVTIWLKNYSSKKYKKKKRNYVKTDQWWPMKAMRCSNFVHSKWYNG